MNLELSGDQAALVSAAESLTSRYAEIPASRRRDYSYYAHDLGQALISSGYLDAACTEGMGPLEAMLVIETVSRLPATVEVGASALVGPMLMGLDFPRPLAIVSGDLAKAHRYLSVARGALIELADDLVLIAIEPGDVIDVETIFAYPYGRFRTPPDLSRARSLGSEALAAFRQWRRIALAAEATGAMRSAVDFTVDYVKSRQMFGHPLGEFQAVQHRLAQCHQISRAAYYMTVKAAWSRDPLDAMLAATYLQQHISKVWFDLHQFNGAMGITTEHKLHFWTYRLRALQGELGGANQSALDAADLLWP